MLKSLKLIKDNKILFEILWIGWFNAKQYLMAKETPLI